MGEKECNGSRPGKPRKRAKARTWMIYPNPENIPEGWKAVEELPFVLVREMKVPSRAELVLDDR